MPDQTNAVLSMIEAQLEANGVAAVQVKDGEVFIFTQKVVEHLVEEAKSGNGRVSVFVKHGGKVILN